MFTVVGQAPTGFAGVRTVASVRRIQAISHDLPLTRMVLNALAFRYRRTNCRAPRFAPHSVEWRLNHGARDSRP